MEPSEFIEDNVVKLDWLNQNEVDFFFKCNTDHIKYNRILDLEADLTDQKVNYNFSESRIKRVN